MNKVPRTNTKFYVYQHKRADSGEVFYVGKGHGKRITSRGRNEYWKRIVEKHGLLVELVRDNLTESEAFDLEVELIRKYRSQGIKLSNMTDGGEGTVGRVTTDESRVNYSKSRLGEKNPMFNKSHAPEIKSLISEASKRNHAKTEYKEKVRAKLKLVVVTEEKKEQIRKTLTGVKHTSERRINQSLAKKGRPSPNKGKKLSEVTKEKLRQANLGKTYSAETRLKVSLASKGRKMSEDAKQKISMANKGKSNPNKGKLGKPVSEETKEKLRKLNLGKKLSEETRKKMSESQKNRKGRENYIVSEETKEKIRQKLKGKKLSEETKLKMRLAKRKPT